MFADVCYLTNELESTLLELDDKNKQLSVKVDESIFLADHDSMTGLMNRRRFVIELEKCVNKGEPFSLVSLDLNHFKLVNDSLGHTAGDQLLIDSAMAIKSVIRDYGIVARMGGDEFSLIIYQNNDVLTPSLLLLLSEKIKSISPENNMGISISTSIGVAHFPDDSLEMGELSSFADIAMYENKRLKVDDFHYYNGTETLVQEEREAQVWQNLIISHLERKTFNVFFQPIIDSKKGTVFSYEALARIIDRHSVCNTNSFINHAENTRRIIDIDKYVLDKALSIASIYGQPVVNINISYLTISTCGVVDYILNVVDEYNYPCEKIIFEITETQEVSNIKVAKDFISRMKKYGFTFALDDFGSGFSSFYYLTKLGIDYIKIDRSIVEEVLVNKHSSCVVKSIVNLAADLNISVVAEGVENSDILDVLSQYDIDFFQGYYFSRPGPLKKNIVMPIISEQGDEYTCTSHE